jgi:hypothetical protein
MSTFYRVFLPSRSLSLSSAAAVSWPNGSNIALTTVKGNKDYREMMYRLSLPASQHVSPPYNNVDEWLRDYPRQKLRRILRRLGQPASKEAHILGTMVKELRQRTEQILGHPIKAAVASFPKLIALYEEEVWDSFEWAGLEHMQIRPSGGMTYQFTANCAANGLGLCSNYTDVDGCMRELRNIRQGQSEFNVRYTNDAFVVEWPILQSAYYWYIVPTRIVQDNELGSRTANRTDDYWQHMRERISQLILLREGSWKYQPPAHVFVTGEGAGDETFRQLLRDACTFRGNDPTFHDSDTLFMGAKGSAELAKRAVYLNPINRDPVWRHY